MSRLLNLKKLKSQYNIYNSSKFVKEKYNRGNKYISVFDKKNNSEELKEKNNNQQKQNYSNFLLQIILIKIQRELVFH